ncbi:MAG: helix-turn-helix transcriptional regulator [Candidatus Dormibacteraceae bacterium]
MVRGEKKPLAPPEQALAVHRALADVSRVGILDELRGAGAALDVAELANRVGLHHNTVRSHLEVLLKAGLVVGETEKRVAPGRPRVVYRPARPAPAVGQPVDGDGFRLLAHILASYLAGSVPDPQAEAIEAGRTWGRYLVERPAPFARVTPDDALRRVAALLDRLGFSPELVDHSSERRILLHRCPFQDLAVTHPEIACSVHLGLIRGALSEMGAPVQGTSLDRFVEPSLCIAHFEAEDEAGEPAAEPIPSGSRG